MPEATTYEFNAGEFCCCPGCQTEVIPQLELREVTDTGGVNQYSSIDETETDQDRVNECITAYNAASFESSVQESDAGSPERIVAFCRMTDEFEKTTDPGVYLYATCILYAPLFQYVLEGADRTQAPTSGNIGFRYRVVGIEHDGATEVDLVAATTQNLAAGKSAASEERTGSQFIYPDWYRTIWRQSYSYISAYLSQLGHDQSYKEIQLRAHCAPSVICLDYWA